MDLVHDEVPPTSCPGALPGSTSSTLFSEHVDGVKAGDLLTSGLVAAWFLPTPETLLLGRHLRYTALLHRSRPLLEAVALFRDA